MENTTIKVLSKDEIPSQLGVADSTITDLRERYTGLSAETPEKYEQVRLAIADVRTVRVSVEHARKALKADALEFGRRVDGEAKRITAALLEIEVPLKEAKAVVDEEAARIQREKDEAVQRELERELAEKKRAEDEERQRVEAERKAEQERIEAEQEAERKRLEKEREELRAAQEKMEAKMAEQKRRIEEENARIEQERQAIEAERKAEQDRKDREELERQAKARAEKERVEAEKAERARREAMRPDVEKLNRFAWDIRSVLVNPPEMLTDSGRKVLARCLRELTQCMDDVGIIINGHPDEESPSEPSTTTNQE